MAARLLPDAALQALGRWWSGIGAEFADGEPGAHTVRYTPGRWAQSMTDRSDKQPCDASPGSGNCSPARRPT